MTPDTDTRFGGFKAERADAYWVKTKDYCAAVRAGCDTIITRDGGITVPERAETGSASGKLTTAAAIKKEQVLIAEVSLGPDNVRH